ncbi:MAG: glycoside hydrolase domain-containing protein [Acidobacteriota bacterium]
MWNNTVRIVLIVLVTAAFSSGVPAQEVHYGTGTWEAETFGNHRVVIRVHDQKDAVWIRIPWRRRDENPFEKNIIIIDAATGQKVSNIYRADINREFGDIVFQPITVPGDYYIYHMPYISQGRSNYPTVVYPPPDGTINEKWFMDNELGTRCQNLPCLPRATLIEIQSIDSFHSFNPMELIATGKEVLDLLTAHPLSSYLLFPEDRKYPIRMWNDLPFRWIKKGPQDRFTDTADRGEFFAFQIGLFAARASLSNVDVRFTDLTGKDTAAVIPSAAFQSFNTEGIDWDGQAFDKTVRVQKGRVQPLWMGIQIPQGIPSGFYEGRVTIHPEGLPPTSVDLSLNITDTVREDAGDSEPWRHSRLRWLNSRIAMDDAVVAPFSPVLVFGRTVSILGRELDIGANGLPSAIRSYFNPGVTAVDAEGQPLLKEPVRFIVEGENGPLPEGTVTAGHIHSARPGAVEWDSTIAQGPLRWEIKARMECDGFVGYEVRLQTVDKITLRDIRLEIPMEKGAAKYMLGLGRKGGIRPPAHEWQWDRTKNQDAVWLGDVNRGLYASFRAENYSRPLNTNFYLSKPLLMPPSWSNEGKGGGRITETGPQTVTISMSSGQRTLTPENDLHFDFILLLTPFKTLDTDQQWSTRLFHAYKPIAEIAATGANTVNNHHANDANPYINYPFIATARMKAYVDEAHDAGMKVKIYNTIRELSNRTEELFALKSLGNEIFSSGVGGGYSWLQEHLDSDYIAAWFVPDLQDAAIINSGMSRWHNYYLEGLNWLAKNIGIDGLYIDDVAFDRTTMKRVRKILDTNREGALIDLHSANQFNQRDGFVNSALLYMEHFPYLNRLWFGEYFDYSSKPDFWLTEVSGIPFGLMGEMLQDGGNPWRGMVYGMTSRLPWAGDPRPVWKVWDDFKMAGSRMYGYWSTDCPVKTDNPDILATAYVHDDRVLIALASWADETTTIRLSIDWDAFWFKREGRRLYAPGVPDFQSETVFDPAAPISVEPGKGWLLILR